MVIISIVIALTVASAWNYLHTRKKRALITHLNGPPTWPLIGSAQRLLFLKPQNFLPKSSKYVQKYGNFTRCWVFHRLFIFIADDEFVTQLLQHPKHLKPAFNMLLPLYGSSVLLGSVGESPQLRKREIISRVFESPQLLADFVEMFVAQSKALIVRLRERCVGKTSFDIYPFIYKTMLDVLISSALGMEAGALQEQKTEYAKTMTALIEHFKTRFLNINSVNPIIYSMACPRQNYLRKRYLTTIKRISGEITANERSILGLEIEKPQSEIYAIDMNAVNLRELAAQQPDTFLSELLTSNIEGITLTDAEIGDELDTFIFHGTLLSSTTLSFALVAIARHPSVQQKVIEELRSLWPPGEARQYSAENLQKLRYLECVIKETMRLYPTQPIMAIDLNENYAYTHSKLGSGELPAGSELYVDVYELLHQADKFEDPYAFRPERHDSSTAGNKDIWLNLGMGPYNSLAQKYVMLLMKTFIADLLCTYELLPFGDELKLEVKLVLTSSNGFQIGLQMR